jgi:CobW/HypB/UreG, nucleotide-binding domain
MICCALREDLLVEVSKLAREGRFDYLLVDSNGDLGAAARPGAAPGPVDGAQVLLVRIIKRLMKFLTRRGFLIEEQSMSYLADTDPDRGLGSLQAAAGTYRIALGPRAGTRC